MNVPEELRKLRAGLERELDEIDRMMTERIEVLNKLTARRREVVAGIRGINEEITKMEDD